MADDEHSCTDDRSFGRGPRYDIKNSQVLALLKLGLSICEISKRLGCSEILVSNVRDGKRKEKVQPAKRFPGRKLCCSCHAKPIKRGNRFLCAECYQGGSLGDVYYDATCYVSF